MKIRRLKSLWRLVRLKTERNRGGKANLAANLEPGASVDNVE